MVANTALVVGGCSETGQDIFSAFWEQPQNQPLTALTGTLQTYQSRRVPVVRGLQTPTPEQESAPVTCNHEHRHQRCR
ncbi:uncharacterized protein Nmag_1613 [Natrialba magadii ATCC 43099]|uniref:Uncharacterized protein n=1 Tax=Natrialba magadii (strain ATCC 43099 / DSM 3394 / CCM 3739 / CIP 104546 / IAM 13178 / JCM 8861 / NBRC 102185 / NCIMB 2190 / MS3) TaxID=547559 RepID=D3SUD1_NATMM|nr:uncharacterized protein Nmag_1613 [Natrialba magadii ATCC 43099]